MLFPKLSLFYQFLSRAIILFFAITAITACTFHQVRTSSFIPRSKAKVEKMLQNMQTREELEDVFSLPAITIAVYNQEGLKEFRSLYRILFRKQKTEGDAVDELTVIFDIDNRLTGYRWGDFLLEPEFPKNSEAAPKNPKSPKRMQKENNSKPQQRI